MNSYELALQRLKTPDHAFSPAPIWWWSGEPLDSARLRWQLERFAEGGVYNLVILNLAPAGPLHGSLADEPHFLTREWWQIFVGVCHDARELGIKIWFYDQIGFSGANLQGTIIRNQPEYAGQQLAHTLHHVTTTTTVHFPDGCMALGAWQIDADEQISPLRINDGQVTSTRHGVHRICLIYAVSKGFDYLSQPACLALRAMVHEAFAHEAGEYFGDVIVGSFQDELPSMPTWCDDFATSFATAYGYDIVPKLIALFAGEDHASQQVRIDYQRWRAKRCEQAFFQPFYDWHQAHGLICGFDQQSPARMALPIGAVDEYADYLQTHRWYGAPGSDHHGNGKIHSSLAHLYERPRSWIEAFHSSGWGGTLEETFDWLVPWIRAGLTLYDPHAVYYSTKGGWWEWAPPSTCWRQPYWRHYPQFADAVMRLTGILALGRHVCDIAVLFPTTTVQAHLLVSGPLEAASEAEHQFVAITGSMFWNNPKPGVLERDRRDFDMLDDDSLARAQVDAGQLQVAGEVYRCLILPALTHLSAQCLATVNAFAQSGGLVLAVSSLPLGVAQHENIITVASAEALLPYLQRIPRRIDGDVQLLERRVDGGRVVFVTPTVVGTQFHWDGHWNSTPYDFDAKRLPTSVQLTIPDATVVEQWGIIDGSVTPVAPQADGTWRISLAQAPAALLFIPDHGNASPQPAVAPSLIAQTDLSGSWQTQIVATVDNQWGDLARPATGLMWPHTMRFADAAGTVQTQGFGTYGWVTAPAPSAALPSALAAIGSGTDPLQVAGWQPLVYSLTRGIHKDRLHWGMLGPKGYVPEEFMTFGMVHTGQAVRVRTTVILTTAESGAFVLAAAAIKRVWLDGVDQGSCAPGYQWFIPVAWAVGQHLIEFELAPEQTVNLRGYWALVRHPERFVRPNWIMQNDAPQAASLLTFARTFVLPVATTSGDLIVVADVPVTVYLDDHEIGRQGGYDPYGSTVRVQPYRLPALDAGSHVMRIVALDGGRGVSLMVDAVCITATAGVTVVMSGDEWTVARHTQLAQPARVRRRQWVDLTFDTDHALYVDMDPGWPLVRRRPHPLPQAAWLEASPADDTVVALVPDAYAGQQRTAQLHWRVPVGATAVRIETDATISLVVDGQAIQSTNGDYLLPPTALQAEIMLTARHGGDGAALLRAPLTYQWGAGYAQLPASFADLGLVDFAGAVTFTRTVDIPQLAGQWLLDLGVVRGTAEVLVNGQVLGARIWSPYQFDISNYLQQGQNTITILVTNTLAPYLAGHSPTHYAPAHQEVSGVSGPIVLRQYQMQ